MNISDADQRPAPCIIFPALVAPEKRGTGMSDIHHDNNPETDLELDEPDLPLIDLDTFYDLLMEEQEQM